MPRDRQYEEVARYPGHHLGLPSSQPAGRECQEHPRERDEVGVHQDRSGRPREIRSEPADVGQKRCETDENGERSDAARCVAEPQHRTDQGERPANRQIRSNNQSLGCSGERRVRCGDRRGEPNQADNCS